MHHRRRLVIILAAAGLVAAAAACRKQVSEETALPGAGEVAQGPAEGERPAASREREAAAEAPLEPGRLKGMSAAHNRAREALEIPPLTWSPELAQFAQSWADKLQRDGCALQHRPGSGPDAQRHGENLFSATGQAASAESVVETWLAEAANYNAKTGQCRGVCGHYTQVVWRGSERLGCGMAACGDTEVWVCNYDPPGNFVGERPY